MSEISIPAWVKWLVGVGSPIALATAGGWAKSRASNADVGVVQQQVADDVQVKLTPRDSHGEIITITTRMSGFEARLQQCEERRKEDAEFIRRVRLDLVGFQAASAQPRAAQRAETAELARKEYLDLTKQNPPADTEEQKAYRRALETRPPR